MKFWGLKSWTIRLVWTTEHADSYAECDTSGSQYRDATIRVNTRKIRREDCAPYQIEDFVAHELGHVSNADLIDAVARHHDDLDGPDVQQVEDRQIERLLALIRNAYDD
jgi:hypothetical protein